MDSWLIVLLIALAIVVLVVGALVARAVLVPKARTAGQATLARATPSLVELLGTGLAIPGTPAEARARARVDAFVQRKPSARRAEPDGSWSLRVLDFGDVVMELVTLADGRSVLWPRSVRGDAQGSAVNATQWDLFSGDLRKALAKEGVQTELVTGRAFAQDASVSPVVWRAVN